MVGKAQKSHGARSEFNSVFGLETVDRWDPIRTFAIQSRSRLVLFLGFSKHEKGALSAVRSASLAKGGTSKRRPSPSYLM
jgi:hypothetical protein